MTGPLPLTRGQERVWRYIKDCERSPSVREIVTALGLKSTSRVHGDICRLEERGFIRRLRNRARAIEVIKAPSLAKGHVGISAYSTEELRAELMRREATGECREPAPRRPVLNRVQHVARP